VLDLVRRRALEPVVGREMAAEVVEVLRQPAIRRYGVTEADVADVVALLEPLLPAGDPAALPSDPDDIPVVAAALTGHAAAIVTLDRDLLDDVDLRDRLAVHGIEVMTPYELIDRLDR
jgi:predicted nucleic acid-binding protein